MKSNDTEALPELRRENV